MKRVRQIAALIFPLALVGCAADKQADLRGISTFYWKTSFALSNEERAWMDSLRCRRLYVKIADIAFDGAYESPQPSALLEIKDTTGIWKYAITPAVFLTNSVFLNLSPGRSEWLASAIAGLYANYAALYPRPEQTHALLLDCDWTEGSREIYFDFLKKLRSRLPPQVGIAVTLRLHQYKFPDRTGIPPADRALLMAYNTGNIGDWDTANSILSMAELDKYLYPAKPYPLPLDPALPLFAWSLVFRDGELWKILPALTDAELASDTTHFEPLQTRAACFRVRKGTFRDGHYLRAGDMIRFETVPPDLLQKALHALRAIPLPSDAELGLFHLNRSCIRRHSARSVLAKLNAPL